MTNEESIQQLPTFDEARAAYQASIERRRIARERGRQAELEAEAAKESYLEAQRAYNHAVDVLLKVCAIGDKP